MEELKKEMLAIKKEVKELKERVKRLEEREVRERRGEGQTAAEGSTPARCLIGAPKEEGGSKKPDKKGQEQKEREKRKRNLVLKGTKVDAEDWRKECRRILKEALGKEAQINCEWGRGDRRGGKIWIVEMRYEEDKEKVLSKKHEIERKERIGIDRDLTYEERETRWWVRKKELEEKSRGREIETGADMVKIEGTEWKFDKEYKVWMRGGETVKGKTEEEKRKEEREREEEERKIIREERERERRRIKDKLEELAMLLEQRDEEEN